MWKDRLSGRSTPSGAPPRYRSQSPAPRASSHLAPSAPYTQRPSLSSRSSSLSLISNQSTSLPLTTHISNGSALKHSLSDGTAVNVANPLDILENILGDQAVHEAKRISSTSIPKERGQIEDLEVPTSGDFAGLSLTAFAEPERWEEAKNKHAHAHESTALEQYQTKRGAFEELHESINACDDVLKSVEQYLANFQADLGVVSAEIEHLQSRSMKINTRLDNRVAVEKLLGPAVEELSISPAIVKKIYEGPVDSQWALALAKVEEHFQSLEDTSRHANKAKAREDISPLLNDLVNKAIEMIRDFIVVQIRALRSPKVNAQIIQLNTLLKFKDLYKFLTRHNSKLAEEIIRAYINTMRWYYLSHFSRYSQSLEKLKIHVMDRNILLAQTDSSRRAPKESPASHDALNLGNRKAALKPLGQSAIPAYLAEESSSTYYIDVPFRNFNIALIDNASTEYSFLTEFLSSHSFHQVSRKFAEIFAPTFEIGQKLTKGLIENNLDCMSVLLCIRLSQSFAFELQRRKIPVLESYINGTNMLLWPRFQIIMDMHCESVRKATTSLPGRVTAALSLTGSDSSKQSAAPHFLTQRFGQLLQSILTLSAEAGDDGPVSSSLGRLRSDFEAFLTKASKGISDAKKQQRFLLNNYCLIATIISDTTGKLAEEQKTHFEKLKQSYLGGS
ncbi:MAG: hypothetical protein M1816_006324 [Peltula sp. TS41687]|nr:MAG: hypothetical protein M1816_006324 [Peltula sp. TS41687]